jgi:glycosyltransferase 2 family protein
MAIREGRMATTADERPPAAKGGEPGAVQRIERLVETLQSHRVRLRQAGLALSLVIVAISLIIFARALLAVDPAQFAAAFAETSSRQIASAFCLSALSYLALAGYDRLALRHLRLNAPLGLSFLASFASYAISFTLGFPLITGGAVRYWIYGPAGLSAGKVASLTLIAGITFWLGMGSIVAAGLIGEAEAISEINHFNAAVNQFFGVGVVVILLAYLVLVSRRPRPVILNVPLPGPIVTVGQMALGVIDVCAAAGALYVLLPRGHGLAFPTFSSLYSFACMLGIASHAPGGIGVFEATMLKTIPAPGGSVLASLLLFRAIYYLAPFILAMALLGAHEGGRRWRSLRAAMVAPQKNGED